MDKKIKVDLPYPPLDKITKDLKSAQIIAPSYAGYHGELTAILQYVYHHFYFAQEGDDETASVLVGISVCEMQHLDIIGEMLIKLGVDPVFTQVPPYPCGFFTSEKVSYSKTAHKMLIDDVSGEMLAIREYDRELSLLDNEQVASVIERIRLDEELHVKALKDRLSLIC